MPQDSAANTPQQLVIDYVLDGENRGYNFITPTDHIGPGAVREIWRSAMPRGQGWNAPQYVGARSLKCIPLNSGRVALSEVTVTDRRDEMGRQGIRRAEVTLLREPEYADYVQSLYEAIPSKTRQLAEEKFGLRLWRQVVNRAMPRLKGQPQIILTHPFTTPEDWQLVEAVVLKLATAARLRVMQGFGKVNPFTTLALDYRDESIIVALPQAVAKSLRAEKNVTLINLG